MKIVRKDKKKDGTFDSRYLMVVSKSGKVLSTTTNKDRATNFDNAENLLNDLRYYYAKQEYANTEFSLEEI